MPQLRRAVSRHAFPAAAVAGAVRRGCRGGQPRPTTRPGPAAPRVRACAGGCPAVGGRAAGVRQARAVDELRRRRPVPAALLRPGHHRRPGRAGRQGSQGRPVHPPPRHRHPATTPAAQSADDRHAGLPTYADALEEMATRSLADGRRRPPVPRTTGSTCTWTPKAPGSTGGHAIPLRLLGRFISDGVVAARLGDRRHPRVRRPGDADPARTHPTPHHRPRPRLPVPRLHHHRLRSRSTTSTRWADGGSHRPATTRSPRAPPTTTASTAATTPSPATPPDPTAWSSPTGTASASAHPDPPTPHHHPAATPNHRPAPTSHPSGGPSHWTRLALPPDPSSPSRHRKFQVVPAAPTEPEPEFVSWLDDPANPDRGLVRVL